MNPSTLSVATGSMVQQHPLLCASTGSSSTSSSSCGTVPSASAVAGEHNGSGSCVYNGMTPMSGPVQQVPYMPQHHLQQQQHQHQQLNSFSSGCQMSANSAAFPHLVCYLLWKIGKDFRFCFKISFFFIVTWKLDLLLLVPKVTKKVRLLLSSLIKG